ncbi:MAG: DUF2911 domain-containing protein [Bacteroidetes bacterium]|nr:DUF2911 domain-containing protein [Bacteroidota bacterium]
MKRFLITFFTISILITTSNAQIITPMASPFSKLEQKVGITDVTVEYSRPSVNGRVIFGDLIPFGEVWRTGANVNTKFTVSDDVKINGKSLKKGTYALYTVPNKENWDVIFYLKSDNWGTPKTWDATQEAVRITVPVKKTTAFFESFTINIGDFKTDEAVVTLAWENTKVLFKIEVPTTEKVEKSIKQVMAGPSTRDYILAARYYLEQEKELDLALTYIEKALESNQNNFGNLRTKALILYKLNKKDLAKQLMQQSLDLAKKEDQKEYIKLNEASLKEWK